MLRTTIVTALFLLTSCTVPSIRVGEKKVPSPNDVTTEQREAWAQGAQWIYTDYIAGHPEPEEGIKVSRSLTTSIGTPVTPQTSPTKVTRALDRQTRDEASRKSDLDNFLRTHEGKTIEGTGINILGFTGSYWFWFAVVVVIVISGGGPIVIMVIRNLHSTLIATVSAVEQLKRKNPQAAKEFQEIASKVMDTKHKKVIRVEKVAAKKQMQKEAERKFKLKLREPELPPE